MKSLNTLIFATFIGLAGLISAPVTAQQTEVYSQAELDQMLAPIALYPDTVLSHVLIAATYPLEVVQAARWSRNNPGYSGQDAVAMVENQDWDPSVKALVAFPELLDRMDQDLGWTQGLGDAFLVQEGEVTDTIQYLRNQAYNNGQLQSNAQVNVVRETRYIYIEPAQPQVVYVPYYDPRVVYGPWRYALYPPVYWHHPPGFSVNLGFHWGVGFHVQPSFFFSSFFWPSRHVVVVDHYYHDRYPNYGHGNGHGGYRPGHHMAHYDGANRWQHSSQHRRGVSYRGDVNEDRFSKRDDSHSRDHSAPVRTAQVRGKQRDWADQQRTRLVDNADNHRNNNADNNADRPLRGDRSRDQSGADTARERNRSGNGAGNRDRSTAHVDTLVDTQVDTLADNTVRDGKKRLRNFDSGDSNSARRSAPLDSVRDNGRTAPERTTGRTTGRTAERVGQDLANSGISRRSTNRSNPQPAAPRSTKQEKSNRSVLPAPAGQPVVERRGQNTNPARGSHAVTEARDRRVTSPAADASPKRETRYAAAAPQRSQKPLAAPRAAPRQAEPQHQAPPPREAAPVRQATVDRASAQRASKPERAAQSQRAESRQAAGKSERANQSGSRVRDRNSRD
ncbi:MAG: DUF3300 domain-containing protein [Xanthomonadales bacterium]|nr:DUF3300 domain-containing protein [Xanthomonadales bacterium]